MDDILEVKIEEINDEHLLKQYMELEILRRAPRSEEIKLRDFGSDFSVTYFLKNKGDYIYINIESGEIEYKISPFVEAKKITDKSQETFPNLFNSAKKDFSNSCFSSMLSPAKQIYKEEKQTRNSNCVVM